MLCGAEKTHGTDLFRAATVIGYTIHVDAPASLPTVNHISRTRINCVRYNQELAALYARAVKPPSNQQIMYLKTAVGTSRFSRYGDCILNMAESQG